MAAVVDEERVIEELMQDVRDERAEFCQNPEAFFYKPISRPASTTMLEATNLGDDVMPDLSSLNPNPNRAAECTQIGDLSSFYVGLDKTE